MKKSIFCVMLAIIFAAALQVTAAPHLRFENSGRIVVLEAFSNPTIGAPFTLAHYTQKWQPHKSFVFDGSSNEGRLTTADGKRVDVLYTLESNTKQLIKGKIQCTAEEAFSTGRLMFAQMLKLIPGELPQIKINGANAGFEAEYNAAVPYSKTFPKQPEQPTVVEVLFPKATLKITGEFDVLLQDQRKWNSNCWEMRLMFNPYQGMLTSSELSFTMELTANPQ